MGRAYLVDIWSLLRIWFEHSVDKVFQPLRIRRIRVFVLRVHDSHSYRATLFGRLRILER